MHSQYMNYQPVKLVLSAIVLLSACALAQDRPPLFFREDWKELPAATPVTQEHVVNPNLLVGLYGPGKDGIKKSHHDKPADDPFYIWTGTCVGNCAIALKHKSAYVDLTGQSKIVWRSKQAGFRELRIILKLANGAWLVGDQSDGPSEDWRVREFNLRRYPLAQTRQQDRCGRRLGRQARSQQSRRDRLDRSDDRRRHACLLTRRLDRSLGAARSGANGSSCRALQEFPCRFRTACALEGRGPEKRGSTLRPRH